MIYLRLASYLCFAVAALCAIAAIANEDIYFVVPAVSVAIVGVVFLAMDRALILLSEIRDALVPSSPSDVAASAKVKDPLIDGDLSQGLADLSNRLSDIRGRQ